MAGPPKAWHTSTPCGGAPPSSTSAPASSRVKSRAGSTWCEPTRWSTASNCTTPTRGTILSRSTCCGRSRRFRSTARATPILRTLDIEGARPQVLSDDELGSPHPLAPSPQRGEGERAGEAGRRQLLTPQVHTGPGYRDGEGARHPIHQPQVGAPPL